MSELEFQLRHQSSAFSLSVELATPSHTLAIVGESGSGKTTLVETLVGIRRDVAGRVRFGDQLWLDTPRGVFVPPERRGVGYVPQEALLFPHLDVEHNLRFSRKATNDAPAFNDVCEALRLHALLPRSPNQLSGGERQRVALGRALLSSAKLLILDEPFSSLDLGGRRLLLSYLLRIRERFALPLILVSHDMTEAQRLCAELVVLRAGQLLDHGQPLRVLLQHAPNTLRNVRAARVLERHGKLAKLAVGAHEIWAIATGAGALGVVEVAAQELLVASGVPRDVSARNLLEVELAHLEISDGLVGAVFCPRHSSRAGETQSSGRTLRPDSDDSDTWTALLTETALRSLRLSVGEPCWLVSKASSCQFFSDPRD